MLPARALLRLVQRLGTATGPRGTKVIIVLQFDYVAKRRGPGQICGRAAAGACCPTRGRGEGARRGQSGRRAFDEDAARRQGGTAAVHGGSAAQHI